MSRPESPDIVRSADVKMHLNHLPFKSGAGVTTVLTALTNLISASTGSSETPNKFVLETLLSSQQSEGLARTHSNVSSSVVQQCLKQECQLTRFINMINIPNIVEAALTLSYLFQ